MICVQITEMEASSQYTVRMVITPQVPLLYTPRTVSVIRTDCHDLYYKRLLTTAAHDRYSFHLHAHNMHVGQ